MASDNAEESIFRAASSGLKVWLQRAKERVMAPWRMFKAQPDPTAIAATAPLWQEQVDRILAALTPALREGWAAANLPGDLDIMDPYIQANLAMTKNLLVRIPDEVHAMVVKEILEGTDAGESTEQIAARVEDVLTYTGSENWPGRARVIAVTEATRHTASSMLGHALRAERDGNHALMKQWNTTMDQKERTVHRNANDDVQSLSVPFIVGGEPLMAPGDPRGSADNVCNCRCSLRILQGSGR